MCSTRLKKVREFLTALRALSVRSLAKVFQPTFAVIHIILLIMSLPPVCTTPFIITTHIDPFKQRHPVRACSVRPQSNTYEWPISNLWNPLESNICSPIGVLNKRNVPHLSVRELLLERDAELLEESCGESSSCPLVAL